ncbi:hypothetical protein [Bacillus sp. mrc49]|uniref:hypothetical protein n=1 Tax=Bacillus sp. mrc49 TaxID=2054913 RepID=UPI000C276DF8|nr:hypothetical protein [Bacillus sp. mrc49]PJN87697.1 hypothetical protein CVN76_24395 [Bacillus sp. mrc49]PJN91030.1 hypothetical protein CVN76_07520 [Bacillus sp. mrc49]PJN91374.1 hypothetical protein CVN76_05325 [Bacillus sp. mrc49]
MTIEHVKNFLSTLCDFREVDITHTFTSNGIRILKLRSLTINSQQIFQLTYPDRDIVDTFSDIAEAAQVITNLISKDTHIHTPV